MPSVALPSSTGSPIASSQAQSPPRDNAVGAPPGAAPTDCLPSPLTALARRTETGSAPLVHPGAVSSSSLGGPFGPSAIAGAMRRGSSASGSGVGAGVARESMTLTSLLPADAPQAWCSPGRWQARSGFRSSAMQSLPSPALSSSAAAGDAPPAVAATTSGAVSLQTRNAGPNNQAAMPLVSSYSSHDGDAAPPSASHTGAHRTTAGPTHAEGRDVAGALAANLAQADVSVVSSGGSAPMRPSSHTSPRASQDVPVYLSATTSDAAWATRSSAQLMLAAAPTLAATANSSASPCTSTVWWAFTSPPFRHSPQVRYTGHSINPIGMDSGGGGRLSVTLSGSIAAGTAASSDAAEGVEPRPRLTATLSSSSSLPSSSLSVYSPSRAGSSAAVSTARPPSMPSVTSVAAGTAAVNVGNAGSGALLFPLQASVPTLRSSNPEDEAAAAELVCGQQRQQQQLRHQASIGVSADVSAVLDSREETGGADDDRRHRQSRPCGSTSSSSHATRARQQGSSLQPPESSGAADSEDKDQPARQNSRRAHDDPKIFMCDAESNAPDTFLTRCEDEGSFAPESVRVRRDVDRAAYHAKAPGGSTANHSRMPGLAGFDALDGAVSDKATATAARGVAVQHQGESVSARSHSSSLLIFSQELQRTLPPSAAITASDHYRRLRQQAMAYLPPSQASEAVDVEGPDTAQQHCPSPAAQRMHLQFSRCCSEPLCEAANSTRLCTTTPPLRLRAGVPPSVLPPRSTSGATHPPPTTPPAGGYERDKSGEEEVEDAAGDCAHSGETVPFLAARSSLSSVTDRSSRSPATTSVVQHIHSHHTAFVAAASSFRTHPPPPAPVTAPSAAASTTPLESPALPSWRREKVQRLANPPLVGSGLLRPKLSATAPAAASMAQGRSPRTPGNQRESHLMSHVRVALIDARSVRSHLGELRVLLPKHRTGAAGATTAQDITGAIAGNSEPAGATRGVSAAAAATADTQDGQHTSANSAAGVRARDDEAGEIGEMLDGGEDSAGIVHCTTAMSPLNFSLRQKMLRDRKADVIGEGCSGGRNTLRARAGTGKASSQLQHSQGLHRNGNGVDGDGSNDGGRSPSTTLSARDLYTSSLNAYRHQRLTRLTEQHLQSLWLGVSAVAKSVCGVAVEQCVEMDLIQGPTLMDGQALRFPSDTAAAAESAAPSLASSSFGAPLQQQLPYARPPSPSSTASTASPNSQGPLQPSGAAVSAQGGEATATKEASRGASKPPPPADPPGPMPSFPFSEAPLTAATAEVTVQRLASTKRDNSPSGRHRDSQRRCLDEAAPLDSAAAGGNGCVPWPSLARTAVSATAATDSTITHTRGEGGAGINVGSSAVATASLPTRTNSSTSASTVVAHPCAHSDCHRSGDRGRSGRHHSTTSPTLLSKWSNAPTSGIVYIHSTPANLNSTTTLPSALSNIGSSSGSRVSNTPSTSCRARGGSGGYVVGTAASSLSSLPRPTASTTATTAGGGKPLYTLPSTLLQLQQQPLQHGSSSQSAPSGSVDGAAPPSSYASPPVATVIHFFPSQHQPLARACTASASAPPTALPHHSSSSLWHSEAGGSSCCPLAGSSPGPMWMLPPPSPASPPPPAAVHRGAAAAAASGASGVLVVAPTVPSALPSPYGATSSGVDAGACALQGLCTRSSGLAPATPFTSPSGSTLMSSLLVAVPNPPPLKAPFIKVQREEVAADTAPDSNSNARVSGARRAAAAFAVSTSGTAAHARGECRGQSPASSALLLTSHERPGGGGVEARTGTAAQVGSAAAAAAEGMARGGTNGASNSVGAVAALPPAIVSPYGMLAEGQLCAVAPIHESMELLAREIHGSGGTPTSSGATSVMMPGSPLTWRGRLEARSSSPVRRSAATGASVTTAGLVPLAANDSSEGVEELSEPFSLMRPAATPLTRGRIGVLDTTTTTATTARAITSKTKATTTTTTNTALPTTGNHPSLGGSMGGVAMHFSLPSTSTLRRQPQLQHALPFSSHAGSHQQDVCLHDVRSHATTATEAQEGEAASTALPSATEQPLPLPQQHRVSSRDEPVGHRDAQELPFLRSSLPLDGTTPSSSTPSPSAASAVSAKGDQQLVGNGESDGAEAAVKASHRLAAHAAAEGAREGKVLNKNFSTGSGSVELRGETGAVSGFTAGHDSTASPPSPRQQQDEQDAGSVAAHPRAASAASSSLSYTTISVSTADATPAAVTAISVSGTRVPSSAPSATLPAPLRAELQSGHGGDGASLTRPMATTGSALHDLGDDEDTNTVVKRSSSSEISSSSASHTPSREALLMGGTRHRPLHAVLPWAQSRPPPTPTSTTASLTMHSADRADALLVRAKDMEREVDVISALMCATSLPAWPGGLATGTDRSHRPSSPTTSTLPARAEVVHDIPATEAEVRKADALVTQSKGEDGTADTPGPLAPSLALRSWATRGGRHVGVCTDSMAAALDTEHSGALTATAQSSDRSHMVAYAGTCSGDDRGEAGEAKRRRGAVSADELAASDSEDGCDLLPLYVNSDAHDLPSSPRRAAAYQQALQQQQYHQRRLMQTWSSIFTISSAGHSAATTSSLRTAITGVALSASVAALGSRVNMPSTMSSGTPTALASVAEVILGIGAAGSGVGGGSAGGVSSGHAGAIPSIGAAATATAAAGSAAASSFTVTVIAPTTAAAGNSTWTPSSTVTLSSDSASAAGFTSPSTLFGTTVSSSASYSLSPERCGIIVSGGAGGGVTTGVHSVSPTGEGEGAVFLPWCSASAPAQTECVFPVAVSAAGVDAAAAAAAAGGSGGGGAACDADFDALRLDATLNSTSASAESTQHVLSRLKPLPHLPSPHNYPFLLPEVTSPCPRDDDGFGEDEDAYDCAQDIDGAVLLDADPDFEPEERHRATAPVRGGSDHSSRVETPCCDGAGGAGSAYGDSSVENHGAVVKSAASPSQHHGDGKVDVGASPTQPPPDSCSNEGPTLTTVAASTRTATTDDGGASLYAAVVPRTAVAHASGVGEVGSAEDDSSTEDRTSSAHLSARSLGIPTARLTAPAGAGPATTAAAGTSSAAASTIEGNEDVRVVSLPRSGDGVPIAPSWPLLCTNTASAAPRLPRIVSDSLLRLRGAVTITASGDALVASTETTAMAAAERERAGAQTSRSASRPHHLSGGGSALTQDGMPASNSDSGNYGDVGGLLFPQNPTPPGAALEEGGGWAEVAATTVSEDTANALVTPGLPAMQHSSQRQTSSCATMASSVTPMAVGDGEGVAKLRDGGGRDADPAVTKALRAAPTASLIDGGGIDQPNRKYVGHRENTLVGEGGASTAVEGRRDRPGAGRSIIIDGDAAAVSHSAETAEPKRRHDDRRAVDANAVLSGAAPDAGDAFPITSTPLAMTPALRAADDTDSDGAVPRLLPEAAHSTVPERTPSATQSKSRGPPPPPPPLPPTQFSIPSYYLAQCEDGLADVTGSLHGWHAATSAFFSGADTAAAPGRTRGGSSSPSSQASDLYTPMSVLARRRAQQRAFYNDAGLSGTAAPSHTTATAADTPLSASAMPELSPRVGATADHTEKAATPPTLPSAAAGATHNDRLLALMRRALRLADGESGAC